MADGHDSLFRKALIESGIILMVEGLPYYRTGFYRR
jgi:hypothetical protein